MRHIPATLATQHPDNAAAPYWEVYGDLSRETVVKRDGFVSTTEEVAECFSAWRDLGCEEYLWDWEGKYVEEAVIERLFQEHLEYFKTHPLGKEKFLTFRIPNIWQESSHGLARAMMCMLTAEDAARSLGLHAPPLFEVILPMTKKASELIHVQKLFASLANFTSRLFKYRSTLPAIEIMPLIEGIDDLLHCRKLLTEYAGRYRRTFGRKLTHLRPHIARSDPALNAGLLAAAVAGKFALSEFYRFGEEAKVAVFPAVGVGTLPFRGSLSPERLPEFFKQYNGARTVYVQSAFRYDFSLPTVKRAIAKLNHTLPRLKPTRYNSAKEKREVAQICSVGAREYRGVVERLAPLINRLALQVPRRRERKLHIGLFGYSRGIGKIKLPRAIPFTAVFYSLGVPPEFIGLGRALKILVRAKIDVLKYYPNLALDLQQAMRFVNVDNLNKLAKLHSAWNLIREDIALATNLLGLKIGPRNARDMRHQKITSQLYSRWRAGQSISQEILDSGRLRRSLG